VLGECQNNGRRTVDEGDVMFGDELAGMFDVPFGHDDAWGTGVPGRVEDRAEALEASQLCEEKGCWMREDLT
jgi:hypothetical protein